MKRIRWGAARALAMLAVCACTALAVSALPAVAATASLPAWAPVSPAAPAPAAEAAFPAYKQDALQATLEAQMARFDAPGAVAGMWFTGVGTWVSAAGTGDLATGAAARPTDTFRIGSITKTFTATVVLQLVDENKLALGDTLSEYVPWVPGARRITVRQLLNMTSGLYNYTASDAFWTRVMEHPDATWTPRQVVKLAVSHKRLFSPGEQYMYCNTNYILLGMIIEKVTGESAAHEITTRIIEKLGLEDTSFPTSSALPEPHMSGYVPADGEPSDTAKLRDWTVASATPYWTAGAMVSTIADLKTWMDAVASGALLSARMHAAQLRFKAPNTTSYGLGVANAGTGFGHSGEVPGYTTSMYYFPSMQATSIAVVNRYPSAIEGVADELNGALVRTVIDDPRDTFTYPDPADFSSLTWSQAFAAVHEKLSHEYAFGAWKGVDWAGLCAEFAPRIAQAQAARDEKAYYLALHEYACSIPDGHISLAAEDTATPTAIAEELAGGGFGMAVAELDDWSVVAAAVVPGGPAAAAGIEAGAEIVSWGGTPARTAIGQIDVGAVPYKLLTGAFGGENPQATREHYRLEQARLLTRAPVGASVRVAFRNRGSTALQSATLKAVDDDGQSFRLVDFAARPEFSSQVDSRILQDGYGYVLVRMEYDPSGDGGYPTRVYEQFRAAIASFVAADVPGVVLDLRGNYGGSDQLAADMCGFFYASPAFYEEQELYDKRTGDFLRITVAENGPVPIVTELTIEPQEPHFGGPVVVLVNPGTKSSGEGPAARISQLPNGTVIGFHGTNGSFGMVGGGATLPGGYSLEYPYGRSVDKHGIVQLDSRNGIGGVAPDLRVPMTLANALAFAAGTDVELEYAVKYLDQAVR
jgi:carboxyl-terminal processing protease